MSLVVTSEDIDRFYNSNKILIDELLKKFENIYILNLYNLQIFTKKNSIKLSRNFPKNIKVINFKKSNELKEFCSQFKVVSISFISKNLIDFRIQYLLKKNKIKLIMVMFYSQIGNTMTIDVKLSKALIAKKHYFNKGFYTLFRILTVINIFPKIDLLFESNLEIINFIKNSRSNKIEKYFPFLKLSYFRQVIPINSIYFDNINILMKNKNPENKNIIYVDTHFDHPDRTSREGEVNKINQEIFYKNLKIFLEKISKIYSKPAIIAKHPANNSNNEFYKSFEISKIPTNEAIYDSEIVIFTVSSAVLSAVLLKKKIINIRSTLLGDYLQNINRQYVNSLGLVSFDIDKEVSLEKNLLDNKLVKSILKYDDYINKKLILDYDQSPSKKISKIIYEKYF